jgi:hypothetical protein
MIYRHALRPLLFRMSAERAHATTLRVGGPLARLGIVGHAMRGALQVDDPRLATEVAGLKLANPIGLGAGIDKSATAVDLFAACGFGFTEVGPCRSTHPRGTARRSAYCGLPIGKRSS